MAKVTMPQLGESVAEGTIGRWLKQPGDTVAKYEPLLEVITDKVNAEVPSPFAGVLKEILAEEGATVLNNAEIAVIETEAEALAGGTDAPAPVALEAEGSTAVEGTVEVEPANTGAAGEAANGPAGSDERPVSVPAPVASTAPVAAAASPAPVAAASGPAPVAAAASPAPSAVATDAAGDPNARMTPAVRRLLREHALEAAQVAGTGGGGRITRGDVIAHVEAVRTGTTPAAPAQAAPAAESHSTGAAAAVPAARPAPAAATNAGITFPVGADEVLVPMTQMRNGIAAQMTRALSAPHAYVQMEIDVTRLVRLRESLKKGYQAKEGIGLSYVPFVVKASAEALKRNPTFNANWTDQGVLAKRRINIGVAVAVDDGLIVPVIRDADTLSIHGLNAAITDVANRARANKLRLDDFGGGTFTVDNTGYLGTNLVMPIINVPEVGIVTMEAITKRAVVVGTEDGDTIAIRPIMNMVLGIDHRANDGAGGAALLRDIKRWLENVGPETAIY
ncbi:MAG: dihydrolipoamide acetyltransferase family protein [Candidatus Limnocylindrales bacterium]